VHSSIFADNVSDNPRLNSNAKRIEDRLPIRVLLAADTIFARIYHSLEVISPCRIPRSGAGIIVSNHTSSIDPAFIQTLCRTRLITWMMAKEYLEIKSISWLFNMVGIIPVERSGQDLAPLRAALRALKAGRVLGIFPEGKISETGEMSPFQVGAALMSIKTKVPIYPIFLDGTQRNKGMVEAALVPNRATITFGPPLYLTGGTSREELETATTTIKSAVEALRRRNHTS
jgi:1-acyl-sn-glycerol-3-phosphate acyltransferase